MLEYLSHEICESKHQNKEPEYMSHGHMKFEVGHFRTNVRICGRIHIRLYITRNLPDQVFPSIVSPCEYYPPFGKRGEQSFDFLLAIWAPWSHPQPRLVLAVYIYIYIYFFVTHRYGRNDEFSDQQAVIRPSENANAPNGDSKRSEFKIKSIRSVHLVPQFEVSRKHAVFQGETGDCLLKRSKIQHI